MEKINHNRSMISVQDMVNFIKKGEEYKKNMVRISDNSKAIEYFGSIILTPDYQREYKSNFNEESSIVESIILGIPIPEVFLVKNNGEIQVRHVMDGQHRLNAIYRFVNNMFALRNLEYLSKEGSTEYNGKKFSDLKYEDQIKILGFPIATLQFEPFEEKDLEIELFTRYNKSTKPLEQQEIAMATYFSKTSQYISMFIKSMDSVEVEIPWYSMGEFSIEEYSIEKLEKLRKVYNVTKNRKEKQKNHQELCIIFSILDKGPKFSSKSKDGVKISISYLEEKAKEYDTNTESIKDIHKKFFEFNDFILRLNKEIQYPFSNEIVNPEVLSTPRYVVGISILLSVIYYYYEVDLTSTDLAKDIKKIIEASPIGDEKSKASTTNITVLLHYLFSKNKIQEKKYNSLKPKEVLCTDLRDIE